MEHFRTREKLEDAIVMLICTASREFVSVRQKPLNQIFKKHDIDNTLSCTAIKYLRSEGYIETKGVS